MPKQRVVPTAFDRATEAATVAAEHDLHGKFVVVTGGAIGLGFEAARVLASRGADIAIGARSNDTLATARTLLEQSGAGSVLAHPLDLMDARSVAAFADAVCSFRKRVDVLINNAGIMASPLHRTPAGVDSQLATNYIGHALLTSRLSPTFGEGSRAVSLTSVGHHISPIDLDDLGFAKRPYDKWLSYGQSKTACSLLAVKVASVLGPKGVTALAVHPGMIQTNLSRFLTQEDLEATRAQLGDAGKSLPEFKSVAAGAATSVWAALAPQLAGQEALYLEDCAVAPLVSTPNFKFGVLPYALDPEIAAALWSATEDLLGCKLPL